MTILNKHRDGAAPWATYIGRGSKWGNPFVIGKDGTRAEVIEKYRAYIMTKPELLSSLSELRGKDLICYCAPLPCHGDVLKELVERMLPELEDLECDRIHEYCSWEGPACSGGPNGPICCEGCGCAEAYEKWKEEHAVNCECCGLEVDIDICTEYTDDWHKYYICEYCDAEGAKHDR